MDARDDEDSPAGSANPDHAYVAAPARLLAFPDAVRARPKGGRRRWKDPAGRLYEWDGRHGTLEVYDPFGRHLGEFDHRTGRPLKPANPRRRIEP